MFRRYRPRRKAVGVTCGERSDESEAVEVRHHEVEDNDVIFIETELQHGFDPVGRFLNTITLALQNHSEQATNSSIILDDEDLACLLQLPYSLVTRRESQQETVRTRQRSSK